MSSDDPAFVGAINREVLLLSGETRKAKHLVHKKAVANVMQDPEAYGVTVKPWRGYCGAGGPPK